MCISNHSVLNALLGTMGNVTKTHATKCWLLSGKRRKQQSTDENTRQYVISDTEGVLKQTL